MCIRDRVYTSLLVGIASGALLYANGNLELALNTLFFKMCIRDSPQSRLRVPVPSGREPLA